MSRRAFVMPIVMLLALIVGLLSSIILARAAQRSGVVRDQLEGYRASHRDRGVKELVGAWLMYSASQDLVAMTGGGPAGGEAFTVRIGRDETVSVRIEPAQTRARINPIGLNVSDGRLAREVEAILRERFGEAGLRQRTRTVGPATIDAARAQDDVLEAFAQAALADIEPIDAETAGRFVSQLRRLETEAGIDASNVRTAGDAIGLKANARDRLAMLLGTTPTMWRITATWVGKDPARPAFDRREVFEGLINISGQTQSGFGAQHPRELFLEWGRADDADGYTETGVFAGRPGA